MQGKVDDALAEPEAIAQGGARGHEAIERAKERAWSVARDVLECFQRARRRPEHDRSPQEWRLDVSHVVEEPDHPEPGVEHGARRTKQAVQPWLVFTSGVCRIDDGGEQVG